jgi:hypothetical protein
MVMALANDVSKASLEDALSRRRSGRFAFAGLALVFYGKALDGSTADAATNDDLRTGKCVRTDADRKTDGYSPLHGYPENIAEPANPIPPGIRSDPFTDTLRCPLCCNPKLAST